MQVELDETNKLGVFPTKKAFGSDGGLGSTDNPLLGESPYQLDGQKMLWNDVFRAVHDYYGHAASGSGFRAAGEENAALHHLGMFSDEAARAVIPETRGQNSFLNSIPGNKNAKIDDTIFADQKAVLMPNWAMRENRSLAYEDPSKITRGALSVDNGRSQGLLGEDGLLGLTHYSGREGLSRINVDKYGQGLSGRTRNERNRSFDNDFLNRSYFGSETSKNPYAKERGLGGHKYVARVSPEVIYDGSLDELGLLGGGATKSEKAIYDKNFSGVYYNHPILGDVFQMFDDVPVEYVGQGFK